MGLQAKVGDAFKERTEGVKHPRVVKIRKIEKFGSLDYVYFMADNQAAQIIHPNGGFTPLENFLTVWEPYEATDTTFASGNGSGG